MDLDPLVAGKDLTALTLATYDGLGMDLRPVVERSDLVTREGKNQHAFCADIDRRHDVRVLANCEPGTRWLGTMVHELGHAVYDLAIDATLPWLLRQPAHGDGLQPLAIRQIGRRGHHIVEAQSSLRPTPGWCRPARRPRRR